MQSSKRTISNSARTAALISFLALLVAGGLLLGSRHFARPLPVSVLMTSEAEEREGPPPPEFLQQKWGGFPYQPPAAKNQLAAAAVLASNWQSVGPIQMVASGRGTAPTGTETNLYDTSYAVIPVRNYLPFYLKDNPLTPAKNDGEFSQATDWGVIGALTGVNSGPGGRSQRETMYRAARIMLVKPPGVAAEPGAEHFHRGARENNCRVFEVETSVGKCARTLSRIERNAHELL